MSKLWRAGLASAVLMMHMAMLGVGAPNATANECSNGQDALVSYFSSHVHAGKSFTFDVENLLYRRQITDATITVAGVEIAIEPASTTTTSYRLRAPERPGRFRVIVRWEQDANPDRQPPSPACAGRDDFDLVAVRPSERIGNLKEPRVAGRWQMLFTPLNYNESAWSQTWRMRPICVVGSCAFNAGTYNQRWRTTDGVEFETRYSFDRPRGSCTVTRRNLITGEVSSRTVDNAFLVSISGTLRTTRRRTTPNGQVEGTRMEGYMRTRLSATGEARAAGCTGGTQRTRVVARAFN